MISTAGLGNQPNAGPVPGRAGGGGGVLDRVPRRHPALARAAARFLASGGLELPPGVPRGEGYREPPDLDDWPVLLEEHALHGLAADPSEAAAARTRGSPPRCGRWAPR